MNTFNTLTLKKISQNTGAPLKVPSLKTQQFHTKMTCEKTMLRQIEWGVQNRAITKNGVLAVTTLLFRKFISN